MVRLRYMGAKGWGAYPVDAVPAGTFVADYTGEVLPVHEAKRRVPAYDRDGLNYVLTTQEFFQGVCIYFATFLVLVDDFVSCERHGALVSWVGPISRGVLPPGSPVTAPTNALDAAVYTLERVKTRPIQRS